MSNVLNKIRHVDPNDSDAVKDVVSTFFTNLPKYTETDCNRWLRALENVINRFPKFCGSHRPTIENYLAHFLDSTSYHNVIEAAKCAHVLQQVKPSQDKAATPKACWREQMLLLCNAAHSLIETLFVNAINVNKKSGNSQIQETQVLSNTPLTTALQNIHKVNKTDAEALKSRKAVVSIRLRNVFVFIQAMLVEIYPVAKPIRPQAILEVILQAISVSDGAKKGLENIVTVKTQALRTLDALVACLGANLVPFSGLVIRFIMQTLRWSSETNSEQFMKVRCAAYNSLVRWLKVLHVHKPSHEGRGKLWEDELTEYIMSDITPPKQVIELNVNAAIPTKNLSKKAKRKLASNMLQESSMAAHMPGEKNKINVSEETSDEVAIAALECAETLFITCGIFLKPATHKIFVERLVRECFSLERHGEERALHVLRAVEAQRKAAPPAVSTHTHYCLHLYSRLLDRQTQISRFCSQALLDIRLQLHCSPPSLNFALEVQPDMKKRAEEKRHTISKRNREVLESLLGAERMPSEAMEEDVISIPDEPVNKKPRQELDTDQISLSSTSVRSIDGSYDSDLVDNVDEIENIAKNMTSDDQNNYDIETVVEITPQDYAEVSQDVTDRAESNVINIEDDVETTNVEETVENIQPNCESLNKTVQPNVDNDEEVLTQIKDLEDEPNIQIQSKEDSATKDTKTQQFVVTTNDDTNEMQATIVETDECLPNTSETDDSELTCGQVCESSSQTVQNTEEVEQKIDEENKHDDDCVPQQNGVQSSPEKILENAVVDVEVTSVPIKSVDEKLDGLTVEDMLADFVDEVIEESKTEA